MDWRLEQKAVKVLLYAGGEVVALLLRPRETLVVLLRGLVGRVVVGRWMLRGRGRVMGSLNGSAGTSINGSRCVSGGLIENG